MTVADPYEREGSHRGAASSRQRSAKVDDALAVAGQSDSGRLIL
jgi:hypothetical protein